MEAAFRMLETDRSRPFSAQQLFVAIVPALFMFALIAFAPSVIPDGDPYWHVAAGEWILAHGVVPSTDPFSYTFAGAPWTAHEWLTEVILAGTYRAAGWSGLHVLVAVAAMAMAFLLARELLKVLQPVPALAVLALALANVAVGAQARPQFLTYPIIVFWLGELLEARRQGRAPHWMLLPLMALWANLHGGFILGLALLGPFALEAIIAAGPNWRRALRDWAIPSIGALIAALVTPFGVEGLLFPFKLMGMPALAFISEWSTSTFDRLKPFEVALLAALFFCLIRGVRMPLIRLGLLLGLLHMALERQRFTTIFALGAALLLAEPIAAALKPRRGAAEAASAKLRAAAGMAAVVLIASIAVLRVAIPVVIADDSKTPVSALASVPETLLREPVFNDYAFGGYLIFKGVRPFIDGRADMYGDQFVRDYVGLGEQDPTKVEQTFAKYGVTWAIVSSNVQWERLFRGLPGWHLHYKDEFASVYVREDPLASEDEPIPSPASAQPRE